ncbi:MAG: hypothetical protein ACREAK_03060, partial [Nitrosarchaeum sp.]
PILDDIKLIYYCAFAKLPGMWVASSLRRNMQEHLVGKKAIGKTSLVYSRQQHIVESCLRIIIGQQFEKLLGRCNYSMTYYYQHDNNYLLRLSIPINQTDFMLIFNVDKVFLEDFDIPFSDGYWKIMRKSVDLDNLRESVKDELKSCMDKSGKSMKQDELEHRIDSELKGSMRLDELKKCKNIDELKKLCSDALQSRQNQSEKVGAMHPLFDTPPTPFLSTFLKSCFCTSEIIRTATIGTIDSGVIFGYYNKKNLKPLFAKHDIYEYFVECASRIKMRHGVEQFFGSVNFVLTVYDNMAVMSIPIEITKDKLQDEPEGRFLLLLTLETKVEDRYGKTIQNKEEIYFPSGMDKIFGFIKGQNLGYLTTGL